MACCIFAAMIIAHLISMWEGFRARLSKVRGWVSGPPEPTDISKYSPPNSVQKPKLKHTKPKLLAAVVGVEIIVLLVLVGHQFSDSHHEMHNTDHSHVSSNSTAHAGMSH